MVRWSALADDDAAADAAIVAEVDHHRRLGVGFEWKVYSHDGPGDLRDRLARHGFAVGPCEAVLAFDLADRAPWLGVGDDDDDDEGAGRDSVSRVDRPELVDVFRRTAESAFGTDHGTAGQLAAALAAGSDQHRGYVAYAQDGTPAAVGRLYTHPRSAFAGLYGGGTVPAHRGQGLYRAVVAARARDAVAAGARYLIVDALPTSRPILERLGFRRVADTWPCEWQP
jgi:hypothetical protein